MWRPGLDSGWLCSLHTINGVETQVNQVLNEMCEPPCLAASPSALMQFQLHIGQMFGVVRYRESPSLPCFLKHKTD